MNVVARQQEDLDERDRAIDERVSGIRARATVSDSDLTHASILRVWLQYNARAPRYVRAALEREIDRLRAQH
jgi:hypothetical protein